MHNHNLFQDHTITNVQCPCTFRDAMQYQFQFCSFYKSLAPNVQHLKRKITFLQDTANTLKSKVKDAERNTEKEQSHLVENIKTIKTQLADLELKQKKFGIRSEKTRTEMATMMKTQCS